MPSVSGRHNEQGVPQKKFKALGQGEDAGGGVTPFRMSNFFEILVSKWWSLSNFIASLAKSYVVKQCVKTPFTYSFIFIIFSFSLDGFFFMQQQNENYH